MTSLIGVLANQGADLSAHEERCRVQGEAQSWATLHTEYQTIARAAQADRWESLLERSGLNTNELEQVRTSEAHGPLLAALGDAAARGLKIDEAFPQLVRGRSLAGVGDAASVLHGRVDKWAEAAASRRPPSDDLIAGLVPRATGVNDPDMAQALEDRERAMTERARSLAETAVADGAPWLDDLGVPPVDEPGKERWLQAVTTIAAYCDRWGLDADRGPLGDPKVVGTIEQLGHRECALRALNRVSRRDLEDDAQLATETPALEPIKVYPIELG